MKKWFLKLFSTHPPTHPSNPQPSLQHLKITLKPNEYIEILEHQDKKIPLPDAPDDEYLKALPTYIIARCPFCQGEYTAPVDTYSLMNNLGTTANEGFSVYDQRRDHHCEHFLGAHLFINLNGIFPEERSRYFRNDYDVPFISPLFLPDEVPSYAVMHSLPICRIENGEFVPRYSLYTIIYYVPADYVSWETIPSTGGAKKRQGIIANRRRKEYRLEWEGFLCYPFQARRHPEWWDLPFWVQKKKLLWLDPASPDLALKSGPVEDFPYANIQGYGRSIEIRNGKLEFRD